MPDIQIKIGKRIREIREDLGISQEELGYRSGLHRTYIGSVERGERNLSIESISTIAKALNMNLEELFKEM
jgi:XRE family transcriptional regulator, regulator of sulfur utilization